MMSLRLNDLGTTNRKPPGANRGATVTEPSGSLGLEKGTRTSFSHSPDRRVNGAVPVNRPIDERGREVRSMLLAIAHACAVRGIHLPKNDVLAAKLGCCPGQVARHMGRLMDEGALELQTVGRRRYVVSEGMVA
jgi:hypothetical protein